MKTGMSVSSFDSVNSVIMYDMKTIMTVNYSNNNTNGSIDYSS